MPRKTSSTTPKATTTTPKATTAAKTTAKRAPARAPAKPIFKYEFKMFTGHGTESLFFNEQSKMNRFKTNIVKRNLEVAPLEVTDATGSLFIIRGFLFAKVIINKS